MAPPTPSRETDALDVLRAVGLQRRKLDIAEKAIIQRARAQGLTLAQIGGELGISRQAVHAKLRKIRNASFGIGIGVLADYQDVLDASTSLFP